MRCFDEDRFLLNKRLTMTDIWRNKTYPHQDRRMIDNFTENEYTEK